MLEKRLGDNCSAYGLKGRLESNRDCGKSREGQKIEKLIKGRAHSKGEHNSRHHTESTVQLQGKHIGLSPPNLDVYSYMDLTNKIDIPASLHRKNYESSYTTNWH